MRDLINKFENSEYRKTFSRLLRERRQAYMNAIGSFVRAMKLTLKDQMLTREELQRQINLIFEFKKTPLYAQDEDNFLNSLEFSQKEKKDLFFEFTKTLVTWYYYLWFYAELEEYELCAQIRDVIRIEKDDFLFNLKTYCYKFEGEADINLILYAELECRREFGI